MGGDDVAAMVAVGDEGGGGRRNEAGAAAVEAEAEVARLLPRMPLRVLLVEGDDQTRHIIAALLRKCGYRVIAVSDGMKAWDTLKEGPGNVDLVLTEVDLPLMSGFILLTMIMDHESCKSIPVIMMSSQDSMSLVFKCILKGAADFLVKPLRKNELKFLWQHVWKKQMSISKPDVKSVCQDHNPSLECETSTKPEHFGGRLACDSKKQQHCQQESDAQSSCTRSELEPEITQNPSHKTPRSKSAGKGSENFDSGGILPNEDDANRDKDGKMKQVTLPDFLNNSCDEAFKANDVQAIAKRQKLSADVVEKNICQEDSVDYLSPLPQLELSLRRPDHINSDKLDSRESRALNHSSSSPFSLYKCDIPTQGSVPGCKNKNTDCCSELNKRMAAVPIVATLEEASDRSNPVDAVSSYPVPVGSTPVDRLSYWNSTQIPPLYRPQPALPFWNYSTVSQGPNVTVEATEHISSSLNTSLRSPSSHTVQRNNDEAASLTENLHHYVSSASGCGRSSNAHEQGVKSGTSSNGCDGVSNVTAVSDNPSNVVSAVHSVAHHEIPQLSPREMALNRFRLKRKERCFEKKVRYESRKRLAEQRLRVKGQFVRQAPIIKGATLPDT